MFASTGQRGLAFLPKQCFNLEGDSSLVVPREGNALEIQWYPGHMAKAKRLLQTQLARVDLAIELCDARLPYSSRNPDLIRMLSNKRRVLLLCKADLADPTQTAAWLKRYREQGVAAMAYDASAQKTKQAKAFIQDAAAELVERARQRGVNKTVRAMVVGVPNVGKSTFINRLYGGAITQVADRPGVTRANQWVKVTPTLELLDTPGMLWPKLTNKLAATRLAYIGTIRDAVYNQEELSILLLADLMRVRREATIERFRMANPSAEGYALLLEVCKGRGFLMRGGEYDTARACAVILDEFREGKLGRLTLETPEPPRREAPQGDASVPPDEEAMPDA